MIPLRSLPALATLLAASLVALPAAAHPGHEHATFWHGVLHPVGGLDHLAAMVAVGLWAGFVGGSRAWAWPASFVAAMVAGALVGWYSLAAPGVELLIAASVVALGLAIAAGWAPSVALGAVAIAAFGMAHGFAHGAEMPGEHLLNPYALGFVTATATLHALGLGLAVALLQARVRPLASRLAGGALASLGLALLAGALVA
jgi:urease accessory protein